MDFKKCSECSFCEKETDSEYFNEVIKEKGYAGICRHVTAGGGLFVYDWIKCNATCYIENCIRCAEFGAI